MEWNAKKIDEMLRFIFNEIKYVENIEFINYLSFDAKNIQIELERIFMFTFYAFH